MIGRPETAELSDYQIGYVSKVSGNDIVAFLQGQLETTLDLLHGIDEGKAAYRYSPGKWSLKEVVGHVTDTERVFAYRALVFSRNDSTPLPGFDQQPWAEHAKHSQVPLKELADEFDSVRRSTIHLFQHLEPAAWSRRGLANNKPVTVHALAYLIGGHTEHHLEILQSRYLTSAL
jgi:DinB superfamily